jgi:glycosyltransferase involved in cell wall biosynthesis
MFSIELLFDNIADRISSNPLFDVRKPEMPTENNFIANMFFALRSRGGIHHITGDIHYIALVLGYRKTILTIHDSVFLTRYEKWDFKYWFIRVFWYQLPIMLSRVVTVISEKTKKELVTLTGVNPDKVIVIPNFYDPRFVYVPGNFNKSRPKILQIGTKSNKNINLLIQALKFIPCELHVVGILEEDTLELLEENKIDYVAHNHISFEALNYLYVDCDIVTFISTYEGFGLPILEACAVGRPLVTSCISPMNEIAEDAAVKVNPYNIFDIRRGLLKIIEDDAFRVELIEKGRRLAQKYHIETVQKMYETLYKSL